MQWSTLIVLFYTVESSGIHCVDVLYETCSTTSLSIYNMMLKYTVDISILKDYTGYIVSHLRRPQYKTSLLEECV